MLATGSVMLAPVSILIADDHDIVRMGLRHMLSDIEGFTVVGEACSGEEALERAAELHPDVVLMDVRMPGIGGIEATTRMQRRSPRTRVVALTACADDPFPDLLLEAGAMAFLTKDSDLEELVSAIRDVHAGRHYVCRRIAQQLALKPVRRKRGAQSPFDELCERELQIVLMVVACNTVQEMADQINISPKTVHTYRYRIFEKLDVQSDVELTLLALRHKLFIPEETV